VKRSIQLASVHLASATIGRFPTVSTLVEAARSWANREPNFADCSKGQLFLETRASKFIKYQEVKVQELSEDVPVGHIPRSLTVQVKGDLTRSLGPGDIVNITGIFLPKPFTGFKAMQAGLVANTYVEAMAVTQCKTRYSDFSVSAEDMKRLQQHRREPDVYGRLAQSIAPEIFGHGDIKKALLLLLCGGVTRQLADGIKIRGDIHICLMGDPGVAKSQLLKHIITVAPRYTIPTCFLRCWQPFGFERVQHQTGACTPLVVEAVALA